MKKVLKYSLPVITLTVFLMTSCVKDGFNNINDEVVYTPSFSLPIGPAEFLLDDVLDFSRLVPIDTTIKVLPPLPPPYKYDTVQYDSTLNYVITPIDSSFYFYYDFTALENQIHKATLISFRVNTWNEFPSDVWLQVSFLNGFDNLLFDLYAAPTIVPAPSINQDGTVAQKHYWQIPDAILEQWQINLLPQTRIIEIYTRLQLPFEHGNHILIDPEYTFEVQLGFRTDLIDTLGTSQ